jgi:hypothetical protein
MEIAVRLDYKLMGDSGKDILRQIHHLITLEYVKFKHQDTQRYYW